MAIYSIILAGKSHGQRSLVGYSPQGGKESNVTEHMRSHLSCGERLLLRCEGNAGNFFPSTQVKDPSIDLAGRNRAPLDVGGTLVLPLERRRVCRGTS